MTRMTSDRLIVTGPACQRGGFTGKLAESEPTNEWTRGASDRESAQLIRRVRYPFDREHP
jgi:hypothetical protein